MLIDEKKIERYIEKMMYYHDIPGVSVGIGTESQLLYNRPFGVKNTETKEPLGQDVFHMASLTKLFVGTCIFMLYEKGLIDLEEKVDRYLPYFRLNDKRYETITVRHLLTHTSGIPDCDDYEWENPQFDDQALERYVKSLSQLQMLWNPGEKFLYSNIGYEILGDIIAKVSGETFENYVNHNIFMPLGLKQSSLLTFQRDKSTLVAPHIKNEEKKVTVSKVFPYNRIHAPSSTLTSTVEDISRWAAVHLNRGELEGVRILKEETYDLIWKNQFDIDGREQICLSWFTREQRGLRLYGHEGSDIGFRNSFCIIPESKLYLSVHANLDNAPTKKMLHNVLGIALGYDPEL